MRRLTPDQVTILDQGGTVGVPAPAPLALPGLGLLGPGRARRRRSAGGITDVGNPYNVLRRRPEPRSR